MAAARDPRIDSMYRSDRLFAWLLVVLLWLCIGFVFYEVWALVDDTAIRVTLAIGGVLLLLFNTASIGAMVAHYAEDKDFIYVLGLGGGGTTVTDVAEKTWAALGQNQVMQAQWEKLGYTAEQAADIITKRF